MTVNECERVNKPLTYNNTRFMLKNMETVPDPFKNYAMKGNPTPAAPAPAESVDLSRLDSMTPEELKTLVRRLACQCGMVASMSEGETAQAILDRFANEALTSDVKQAIGAGTAWFDRTKGKPGQSVTLDGTIRHVTVEAMITFADQTPLIEHEP